MEPAKYISDQLQSCEDMYQEEFFNLIDLASDSGFGQTTSDEE